MRRAKRVRFVDSETDDIPNNKPNTSSRGGEAAQPRVSDTAKTSEYAFFRKIKKNAGQNYSHAQPQENIELKNGKSYNHKSVGISNISDLLKRRTIDAKFSHHAEELEALKHNNSVVSPMKDNTPEKIKKSSSQLSENIAPFHQNVFFSPVSSASVHSVNQCFGEGIFAEKRQKLHKLAANTLLPVMGKSRSKGSEEVIPTLLTRLLPNGIENDDQKLVEEKLCTNDPLLAQPMSNVPEKKLNLVKRRRSRELTNESSWSDFIPTYSSRNAKNVYISEPYYPLAIDDVDNNKSKSPWIEFTPRYSSSKAKKILKLEASDDGKAIFQNEGANRNYVLNPDVFRTWCKQSEPSYEKYGHSSSFHIEELPEYYDPDVTSKRETRNLLLEWDFNKDKEKIDFYPSLRISRDVHNKQIMDDKLDESVFSWSSFFSQYSSLSQFEPIDFKRRDEFSSKYLIESGECDTDNIFKDGQDYPLCISNVFDEKHPLLLPSLSPAHHAFRFPLDEQDFSSNLREDYVSSLGSVSKYQDYSFTDTFDGKMSGPLLLDSSCWNKSYLLDHDYSEN